MHKTHHLQTPTNQNLSRALAILLPDILQRRLPKPLAMRERRISLDDDITLVQPLRDIGMVQPRVQFVLADGDLAAASAFDILLKLFEVMDTVV